MTAAATAIPSIAPLDRPPEEEDDVSENVSVLLGPSPVVLAEAVFDGSATEAVKAKGLVVGLAARVLPIAVT